ncbi:MAG TPA: hypothetical protein VN633_18955 [Bryobacteraceae bacterium]|nr:hypothetical protein [Bryobacteraceae bacterium]
MFVSPGLRRLLHFDSGVYMVADTRMAEWFAGVALKTLHRSIEMLDISVEMGFDLSTTSNKLAC